MTQNMLIADFDFFKCVRRSASYSGCSGWSAHSSVVGVFAIEKQADGKQVIEKMLKVFGLERLAEYHPNTGDRVNYYAEPLEIKF